MSPIQFIIDEKRPQKVEKPKVAGKQLDPREEWQVKELRKRLGDQW